jgi:hypothetical protein
MDLAAELGIDPADRTALLYTRSASWLPLPGGFQAPSTV